MTEEVKNDCPPHLEKHVWKPGYAPYAEWVKKLTPEQYAAHQLERKKRKTLKQTMKAVQDEYRAEWAAALHNAAVSVIEKAIREGDPNAFNAVWDRFIGKPKETEINDDLPPLPFDDNFSE